MSKPRDLATRQQTYTDIMVEIRQRIHLVDLATSNSLRLELPFINEGHVKISSGDSVFCYTDGITELENLKGDFYGMEALKLFIEQNINNSSLDKFHERLIADLDQFREGNSFSDDVTILSLRSLI